MRRVINEKLVSLIVAILAMVAILFGVKTCFKQKSTEEVETSENNSNYSYLTGELYRSRIN